MQESLFNILLQATAQETGRLLWLADENGQAHFTQLKSLHPTAEVLSNRFDIYQSALQAGLSAQFNDWEFAEGVEYDNILLRICKEKQVNLHLITTAATHLSPQGSLVIAGEKNDGIKTYCKTASNLFLCGGNPKKLGEAYLGRFTKPRRDKGEEAGSYHKLVEIGKTNQITLYSKPGIYGWNKIDQGSQLLIEQFRHHCQSWASEHFISVLDLGCGYGYLSFAIADLPFIKRTATDNNAAAVAACRYTAAQAKIPIDVIAGDCAQGVEGQYQVILCNPPFHKGFDLDGDLTMRFLRAARQKLSNNGQAFFVVNSFIGIEKKATHFFRQVDTLINNNHFKVLHLQV